MNGQSTESLEHQGIGCLPRQRTNFFPSHGYRFVTADFITQASYLLLLSFGLGPTQQPITRIGIID